MAVDMNGTTINEGDSATIKVRVTAVRPEDILANITVRTLELMPPYDEATVIGINSKQVEIVAPPGGTTASASSVSGPPVKKDKH